MTPGRMSIDKAIACFQEAIADGSCIIPTQVTREYREKLHIDAESLFECIEELTPGMLDKDEVGHNKPGWHYAFKTMAGSVPIYLKFLIGEDQVFGTQYVELTSVHSWLK